MREDGPAIRRRHLEHPGNPLVVKPVAVHGRKQTRTAQPELGEGPARAIRRVGGAGVQHEQADKPRRLRPHRRGDRFFIAGDAGNQRRARHLIAIELRYPAVGQPIRWTRRLPSQLAGNAVGRRRVLRAVLLAAERLVKPGREKVAMRVVENHADSERVLNSDQRCHLITQPALVELEEQIDIEKQPFQQVGLQTERAA